MADLGFSEGFRRIIAKRVQKFMRPDPFVDRFGERLHGLPVEPQKQFSLFSSEGGGLHLAYHQYLFNSTRSSQKEGLVETLETPINLPLMSG